MMIFGELVRYTVHTKSLISHLARDAQGENCKSCTLLLLGLRGEQKA